MIVSLEEQRQKISEAVRDFIDHEIAKPAADVCATVNCNFIDSYVREIVQQLGLVNLFPRVSHECFSLEKMFQNMNSFDIDSSKLKFCAGRQWVRCIGEDVKYAKSVKKRFAKKAHDLQSAIKVALH